MKLYMIGLGGKAIGANIEVHDVQFALGQDIDNTIGLVKDNWYGLKDKLHMDSYKHIAIADGHEVMLTKDKPSDSKRLFFVCFGGYDKETFQELHRLSLLVAETIEDLKLKAMDEIKGLEEKWHIDQIVDVEECFLQVEGEQYYISLSETDLESDMAPDWYGFRKID